MSEFTVPDPLNPLSRAELQSLPNRILNESYDSTSQALYIRGASGCFIDDIDGRRYIDMALGGGTAILGHANSALIANITRHLIAGTLYALPNPIAHQYGEILHQAMPWFSSFVFSSTGSEATLRAMRLARAFNGKKKVALFSGSWHGSHDMVLVEEDYSGSEEAPRLMFKSAGTPRELADLLLFLPYNHSAACELIKKHRHELALVMIEPSQGSNPRDDIGPFLKDLRQVTKDNDILLCFDEVISGGRLAFGGAQEHYAIQADLATYGKVLGGGLPMGILGGTAEVMKVIRPTPGEDRIPVFMGGTFSANPMSVAAGLEVMRYLQSNREWLYTELFKQGNLLKEGINDFCRGKNIPVHMMGIGSMLRLVFSAQPIRSRRQRDSDEIPQSTQKEFYAALLQSGVHVGTNRLNFLSTAHSQAIVEKIIEIYASVIERFNTQGKFTQVRR